jgi:hypothetical protein
MYKLFRKQEIDADVWNEDVVKQLSENLERASGLGKPR